jgi:Ca-activated chloride channel homolog
MSFKTSQLQLTFAACCIATLVSSVLAQEEVIRVDTALVNLNVVVMDRQGKRVSGLTKEDFEVYEDGARQEITHFAADQRSLRLVLVFDISVSMGDVLPIIKHEAIALLGSLRSDDEVSVVSFASEVRSHSGWLNKELAADVIRKVTAEPHPQPVQATIGHPGYRIGDTNTYLYEAFRYIFDNFRSDSDRIAVVMFSDGIDTAAGRSMPNIRKRVEEVAREVLRQANETWTIVYPIRYKTEQVIGAIPTRAQRPFPNIRIGSAPADPGRKLFEQIAAATGGEIFDWTTRQDFISAVRNALADLRSQYGLGYKPPRVNGKDGFRHTKVRVKRANLAVRTRDGYTLPKKI